jgi:dephospho-CoA kinase
LKVFGITGYYCAGKNYAAQFFAKRGFAVLDVDKLGHIAIENKKQEITSFFGADILNADGSVNRRNLGLSVFGRANKKRLIYLESIVHPEANRLSEEWLSANKNKNCLVNAALLHKSSVLNKLDGIIIVKAPLLTRLRRAKKRDNLSWPEILRRFSSQKFPLKKTFFSADTYCIYNFEKGLSHKGKPLSLENQIDEICKRI